MAVPCRLQAAQFRQKFRSPRCLTSDPPIIDMNLSLASQRIQLHNACKNWGIFRLKNHGVDTSGVVDVIRESNQTRNSYLLHYETHVHLDSNPILKSGCGENGLLKYTDPMYVVAQERILPLLNEALLSEYEPMEKKCQRPLQKMMERQRCILNYNPHWSISPFDLGGITIISEDGLGAFEFKKPGSSQWLQLENTKDSLLVIVGDHLEVITNGDYKSAEHRLRIHGCQPYTCLASSHAPRDEELIVRPLFDNGKKPMYTELTYLQYKKLYYSMKHANKSALRSITLELTEHE